MVTKTQLTKKSGKDNSAEAINMLETVSRKKTELQSLVDVCKAAVAFSKKRTRKQASLLADKLHEMRSSGMGSCDRFKSQTCPSWFYNQWKL